MPKERSMTYRYKQQKYLLNQPLEVDVQHLFDMEQGKLYPNSKERVESSIKRKEFLKKVHKLEKERIMLLEKRKEKDNFVLLNQKDTARKNKMHV
jgi:hypothetical protein